MDTEPTLRDGAAVRFPPPLIFMLALACGYGLNLLVPSPQPFDGWVRVLVAKVPILLGVVCMAGAMMHFYRTKQNPEPWKPTPELIHDGIYRWTRNPMYLGMGLIQIGIGAALNNLWMIALVVASWTAVSHLAIRPEEQYLEAKFGDSYRAYQNTVGRWFGRRLG